MGTRAAAARQALRISVADGSHALEPVRDPSVIGPIDFAWRLGDGGAEHTTFGAGPIAGSFVPGANRLVVCGRSPLWGTFYPSTIGGAGLPWGALGASYLVISGRAARPSVLLVGRVRGELVVSVEPLDPEAAWQENPDGDFGLYALMHTVYARARERFPVGRVLAVGPAAARVRSAAIGSAPIVRGRISSVDTWAGRGGLGSRLYQHHRVVALVFGGDEGAAEPVVVHGPLEALALEKTRKYRFDPKFKTGGTFGSNFHTLRERALSFNYRSVLFDDDARVAIHERLIAGHYLRQFDEEIVAEKKSATCGEPCGAACKKVDGKLKKDYEPYQSMGPLIGVFDQRAAERINRYADSCGFDAIQVGGEIAWVMECLDRGWLAPADVGAAAGDGPRWDPARLEPVADSAHNEALGRRIIRWLLDDPRAADLRRGLRAGARALGGPAREAAVYNASGPEDGCMVPNQYWVPGMFAPVPIMGRYYLDYTYEWKPPRELGRSCAERMIKELMLDNYGMCRFHRGWAEELLPGLVGTFAGIRVDAAEHHRSLALELHAHNAARPWETERVIDMVRTYLVKYRADGPREVGLDAWIDRFARDKRAAAAAYWQEMRDGFDEGLRRPATS